MPKLKYHCFLVIIYKKSMDCVINFGFGTVQTPEIETDFYFFQFSHYFSFISYQDFLLQILIELFII